jgi:methylthioribose-1-phosphate isomerase
MSDATQDWFTLRWSDSAVLMLDQRRLPDQELYVSLESVEEIARAIEDLVIRGAPAIGCAAAMGIARAAVTSGASDVDGLLADLASARERLAKTRPTAVNLFWALERMEETWKASAREGDADVIRAALIEEAQIIHDQDIETCRAIGSAGLDLVPSGSRILTHCNAGALATAGYGTALGLVRAAHEAGREVSVLADETRPYLQGARLTAWELQRDQVPVTVITDNMSGHLMQRGEIDLVIVGADRIAANGDVANKIGTYSVAVLARAHGIPFYVAAPVNTVDLATPDGSAIPIEERGRSEVAELGGRILVPHDVPVRHPAFDITPAEFITAIVTERGVIKAPFSPGLAQLGKLEDQGS